MKPVVRQMLSSMYTMTCMHRIIRVTMNICCYGNRRICCMELGQKGGAEAAIHAAMRSFNYRIKHAQIGWEVVKDGGYSIITSFSPFHQLRLHCQLCLQPVPKADPARKQLIILPYVFRKQCRFYP